MAVFSTTLLLFLIFFIRVNCADDYDDVTTHRPQQDEDDVTRGQKSFDDVGGGGVIKTKSLNVLERKLKTQRVGGEGVGDGEEVAGVQVPRSEVKRSRSWVENTMFAWGKRHGQPTLSAPRGKRSTAPHRRRWSDHSMSTWGRKRSLDAPGNEEEELRREETGEGVDDWTPQRGNNGNGEVETEDDGGRPSTHRRAAVQKRRWSDHSMSVWGKRRIPTTRGPGDGEDNRAAAVDPENEAEDAESHPLNQGTSYPALGDRGPHPLYFALFNQRNGAPKRNWATNTMNVWGKRSTSQKIQG